MQRTDQKFDLINKLFRLFLTFNATSLIIVVYLIKTGKVLNTLHPYITYIPHFISYTVYALIPVVLTFLSLILASHLGPDSIESDNEGTPIKNIEQANNAFLPSYLGYFFVALSVPNSETLIFVFAILFVFTFLSQTLYFNPLFLIFGFQFYYVITSNNVKLFLITKKKTKDPNKFVFPALKRINDFTFIELKEKQDEPLNSKN